MPTPPCCAHGRSKTSTLAVVHRCLCGGDCARMTRPDLMLRGLEGTRTHADTSPQPPTHTNTPTPTPSFRASHPLHPASTPRPGPRPPRSPSALEREQQQQQAASSISSTPMTMPTRPRRGPLLLLALVLLAYCCASGEGFVPRSPVRAAGQRHPSPLRRHQAASETLEQEAPTQVEEGQSRTRH